MTNVKFTIENVGTFEGSFTPFLKPEPKVIFKEDWETGVTNWNLKGEINAGGALRASTLVITDPTDSTKRMLRMRANENVLAQTNQFRYDTFSTSNDVTIEAELYFPQRIDLANNWDSFINFLQFKGVNNDGNKRNDTLWMLGINTRGGKGSGGANFFGMGNLLQFWPELGGKSYSPKALAIVDIPFAKKFKIKLRYKLASDGTGIIQFWQDGVLIYDERGITFPSSLVKNIYFSINNYGMQMIGKTESGAPTSQTFVDILVGDFIVYETTS